jgi:hypothetical protein
MNEKRETLAAIIAAGLVRAGERDPNEVATNALDIVDAILARTNPPEGVVPETPKPKGKKEKSPADC